MRESIQVGSITGTNLSPPKKKNNKKKIQKNTKIKTFDLYWVAKKQNC